MARYRPGRARRETAKARRAWLVLLLVLILGGGLAVLYVMAKASRPELDEATLCPDEPVSHTVLLVDVTDPMNPAQQRDFMNRLDRLRVSVPRHGLLSIVKVDATGASLLRPVIERCNPGEPGEVSPYTGNPAGARERWEQAYRAALDRAFLGLAAASGASRSPILESVQSVALTHFQALEASDKPRHLIIASDFLQNSGGLRFYGAVPDAEAVLASAAFRAVRTDLTGVTVELWMIQRFGAGAAQPPGLLDLWQRLIEAQGGRVTAVHTLTG